MRKTNYKSAILKLIREGKVGSVPSFSSLYALIDFRETRTYFTHCMDLAWLIAHNGVATEPTDSTFRRRAVLGLQPISFGKSDARKLAEITGLMAILEKTE